MRQIKDQNKFFLNLPNTSLIIFLWMYELDHFRCVTDPASSDYSISAWIDKIRNENFQEKLSMNDASKNLSHFTNTS